MDIKSTGADSSRNGTLHKCLNFQHVMFSKLQNYFYKFGLEIYKHRFIFVIVPIFVCFLCITGVQNMVMEDMPTNLFYPENGHFETEQMIAGKYFPINYSEGFDVSRLTDRNFKGYLIVLINAKDSGTVLRKSVFNEVMKLNNMIRSTSVNTSNKVMNYEKLCAKWDNACIHNHVLDLNDTISDVESGNETLTYPYMLYPFVPPHYFGGVEINDEEGVLIAAKYLRLFYWLDRQELTNKIRAEQWENNVMKMLSEAQFQVIEHVYFCSQSWLELMRELSHAFSPFLPMIGSVIIVVTFVSGLTKDCVRSKPLIAIVGLLNTCLSTFAAAGFLSYCGLKFSRFNFITLFLMIGVGFRNVLHLLTEWQKTGAEKDASARIAMCYKSVGVCTLMATLNKVVFFLLGMTIPIFAIQSFCLFTAVSLTLNYISLLTLVGASLAYAGDLELEKKHCITFQRVEKSQSSNPNLFLAIFCSIRSWPRRPSEETASCVFTEYFIAFITSLKGQFASFGLLFMLWVISVYGLTLTKENFDITNTAVIGSNYYKFYQIYSRQFYKYPHRTQVFLVDNVTYSDRSTARDIVYFVKDLENLPYTAADVSTKCWVKSFYRFLKFNTILKKKITDEASFIKILREDYLGNRQVTDKLDIVFNANYTRIVASRFIIQPYELRDGQTIVAMTKALRDLASRFKYKTYCYTNFFSIADQLSAVIPTLTQLLGMACVVVTFWSGFFLPQPVLIVFCANLVSVSVIITGFLVHWDIDLDHISVLYILMTMGFAIDFIFYVPYIFLTSDKSDTKQKLEESVKSSKICITSAVYIIITGLILMFINVYTFQVLSKIIVLVVCISLFHGILMMPMILYIMYIIKG